MARVNKFASVNLNDLYGKEDSAAKSARNSSGSAARLRGATHGGMLVLTRPVKQQGKVGGGHVGSLKRESGGSLGVETANNARGWTNSQQQVEPAHVDAIKEKSGDFPARPLNPVTAFPTPTNSQSCTVGKDVVLSEEFPTLQASLAPAIKNIEQLQLKDTHEEQDMHLDLIQQQERSAGSVLQPSRSQPYRPPQLREDSHTMFIKAEKEIGSSVQSLFPDPFLIRGNRAAEWADDKRENGNKARPVCINTDQRLDSGNNQEAMLCLDMGGINERDIISRPASGGGRYGREAISQPNSGGGRSRGGREAMSRPSSGGGRYERLLISQSGSGGGLCEREVISQSNSGGSTPIRPSSAGNNYGKNRQGSSSGRNERGGITPVGSVASGYINAHSGAGRCEREFISQPVSGSSDNARPGSGGSDYARPRSAGVDPRMKRPSSGVGRYEREVFPQQVSRSNEYFPLGSRGNGYIHADFGAGRCEREIIARPGSGSSDNAKPSSGGSDYARPRSAGVDSRMKRPSSRGGRYEREVFPQQVSRSNEYFPPGAGGSGYIHADFGAGRCESEFIARPGSGSGDNARPGSGGSDYGRPRSAGVDSRMKRPSSGGGRYGGRYGSEFVSRPGSGGSDSIQPGSGGKDYTQQGLPGIYQCSPRDLRYNAQENVVEGVANPHRSYGPDVHHGWQNIYPSYESNRENGAHRDNSVRPGVASREFPKRDDYVRRGCNMEGYGGDGRYDYAPVECRQNFGQGTVDGRFPEQPREQEEALGSLPQRPKPGDYGVNGTGKPLVFSELSFDNECMHQDRFQSKNLSTTAGKTSASDLCDHLGLQDSVNVVEDQTTIEVDVAKQDDKQNYESMEKVLASSGQQIRQVDFKEDVQCPWVDEKMNYLREEEERKENAKKKLLELEERIAKREAQQKRNAEDIQQRKEQEIVEHVRKGGSLGHKSCSAGHIDNSTRSPIK